MMSAFWSGTDINAINEFSDGDLSFALVVNLKGEYNVPYGFKNYKILLIKIRISKNSH